MSTDEDSAPPASANDLAGLIAVRQQSAIAQAMAGIEGMLGRSGAQALCLECPALPMPQAAERSPASLLIRLQRFFARI